MKMMFSTAIFDSISGTSVFASVLLIICLFLLLQTAGIKSLRQYVLARILIYFFLKKEKRKFQTCTNLKRTDLTPVDVGIIPSTKEYEFENPQSQSFQHSDGIHFVGISSDKHMIDVCINKIEENMALVWVYLKLPDGSIFKFPFGDTRKAYIASENMFSSSGLQIKCLSPLRKWRISFNGILQKFNSQIEKDDELTHVRFSFIWLAMSGVQEQNFAYTQNDLAKAFMNKSYSLSEKDLKCVHELQNRYDQWGQMMGTIMLNGESEKELYFWSIRTRIMDSPLWNKDIVYTKLYIYFMDGIPLKVESVSIAQFISNLTSGFSITPYGGIKSISHNTFNMDLIKENQKEIKFSYIINGKNKNIQISFMEEDSAFDVGPELQFQLQIRPFKVTMDDSDEGFGIMHYSVISSNEKDREFQIPPVLLKDPGYYSLGERTVLLLDDEKCTSSLIAGGKGSSLALLTKLSKKTGKFIVPRGFVITTTSFISHLVFNKSISDAIERLKDVSCKVLDGDLKAECKKCQDVFVSTQLSECLKNEIKLILGNIFDSLENIRFSIRSSAFGEDSEDLSAAGQMLTILGVRGIDKVFKAVIECWASKFSFEAVQYARQNGQSILSSMAVVVQEMVPSDFSGVMFTVDPVSGNPIHPYITANFGLGETVVSALADPDTTVLKREKDQSLQIFKTHVGSKMTQVFMKNENGVEQMQYESQAENSCLTDEWAIKIGNAGILIESCFCSPRDIEWAVHKDQLYLLQARPITTLHHETDFELIHDQDTPVRSVNDYWTRANTGEVFLGATSPLGIALVVAGMDNNAHKGHIIRDAVYEEFCPYFFHVLPVTHRQITLNIVDTLFKTNEKEITSVQKAFEIALFGRPVITEDIHQAGIKKHGYASTLKKYSLFLFILLLSYSIPREIAKMCKEVVKYKVDFKTYTSAKKTWDGILEQMNPCIKAFSVHGMATFLSSFYNMILLTILSRGKKDWDAELYCDFSSLLSSCSGVESADVPESLQQLAQVIAQNNTSIFSSVSPKEAYDILKSDTGASGKLFQNFLEKHGHRCVKEFDIYSKSWGMQPESLIPTLQNMVKVTNIVNNTTKENLSEEAIISKIKTPVTSFNKRLLQTFLSRSRKYVSEREKTKSVVIKYVDWLRKSCYHLGTLMVREGMLPDEELVFFLTAEEIKDILDSQKPGLISKAVRRKRLHLQLNELKLPEIMKGIPKPVQIQQDYSSFPASFTLKGTPVCQGIVKGKAVVVLTLEEASKIESCDILITHATDIGWSPYFPLLSGVVTVLGGLISHGAVVAREFGLPCVVGVENATIAFKSGDTVILNGTEGTVTKILDEETK